MFGWDHRDDGGGGGDILRAAPPAPAMQQGQWGIEETKELIRIRAEAERGWASDIPARKSKALWEAVSSELLLRGFVRTPDQCKCKWKNLLIRYKGKETSDQSNSREFPFFAELHALFAERSRKMHQTLQETNIASPSHQLGEKAAKNMKRPHSGRIDESSEDEEDKEKEENYLLFPEDEAPTKKSKTNNDNDGNNNRKGKKSKSVVELMEEFARREAAWEKRWEEMMERRYRERAAFEEEWRERALRVERERLAAEQAWREREEARREREEARRERMDGLLTSILNSFIHDRDHDYNILHHRR